MNGLIRAALVASGRTTAAQQTAARVGEVISCSAREFALVHASYLNACYEPFFQHVFDSNPEVFPLAHHSMISNTKTFLPELVPVAGGVAVVR